jgi:predicted ester cyclase
VRIDGADKSLADYAANLQAVIDAFPDYRWEIRHLLVDGDWLAGHFVDTGTHRGPFLGILPTGRAVETQEFALYRVAAGRIAEVWGTVDELRLVEQLR